VPFPGTYRPIGELPQEVQNNIATFIEGGMYGPYREGDTYSIYKLADIKDDTTFSTRASHILFRADSAAGGDAEALRKAREVLAQIKAGASFEEMARVHGTDGTAQSGGDLGWFTRGRMVKGLRRRRIQLQRHRPAQPTGENGLWLPHHQSDPAQDQPPVQTVRRQKDDLRQ
jgi:hypothetical protein